MYRLFEQRLSRFRNMDRDASLAGGVIGLEKESLRVSPDGVIALTPHPMALGSALTHQYITTDYSEALIELITPPLPDAETALGFLRDTHKFVHENLGDEFLWSASMPCVLPGGEGIPIAQYGDSNAGIMKTVYRRGLGHRYGRVMQVIAGVHFNYSLPMELWPLLQDLEGATDDPARFRDDRYFGLIRNLQRYGWLIPYLFGASPAVCKSYLQNKAPHFSEFNATTYFQPFATSLRMGNIGYTNRQEEGVGVKACYDDLESYVDSLIRAIETPCPRWQKIGVVVNGRFEQLNANLLQIENEYYSTVRPKQPVQWMEKPALALRRRGVQYVELRSLDVNPFHPLGISKEQIRFLEAFMLFCLLQESPRISPAEQREIDQNLELTAHRGREPLLQLQRQGSEVRLSDWAAELCDRVQEVCGVLDAVTGDDRYTTALAEQRAAVADPERTPSARMLAEMRENGEGFFQFAQRVSQQHHHYFQTVALTEERRRLFQEEAERSREQQRLLEQRDSRPFAEFLQDYFAQH